MISGNEIIEKAIKYAVFLGIHETMKMFWIQQDRYSSKELLSLSKLHDELCDLVSKAKVQTIITDYLRISFS